MRERPFFFPKGLRNEREASYINFLGRERKRRRNFLATLSLLRFLFGAATDGLIDYALISLRNQEKA